MKRKESINSFTKIITEDRIERKKERKKDHFN